MEAKTHLSEVPCPLHPTYSIQGVNLQNPAEPKLLCFTCVLQQKDVSVLSNLKAFPDLIKTAAEVSIRNRNFLQPQEKPSDYVTLLSLKDERIEQLCKHIEQEKAKVSNFFESLIKEVTEILLNKKKQHLEELDRQVATLTLNFIFFEKELKRLYPSDEDLAKLFPTQESLEKRFQSITQANELMDFVKDLSFSSLGQENDAELNKKFEAQRVEITRLSKELLKDHAPFEKPESWKASEFTEEIKERVAYYFDPGVHLQSPIQKLGYQEKKKNKKKKNDQKKSLSTIVTKDELNLIVSWLPENVKFNPKLLYRSSRHGRNPETFHQQCDGKRNTVTIVKALFNDTNEPCVIGGFLDEPWLSNPGWIKSNNAFLFSLTAKMKCPILLPNQAAFGYPTLGPSFGSGNSFKISLGDDSFVFPASETFEEVSRLVNRQFIPSTKNFFKEIEVEVFSLD